MSVMRRAVGLLGVPRRRFLLAVLAGSAGMGSAVALAAVSAWLIARASQLPPVAALTLAAVAVRALGISRGVLRYLDRLVSHDIALRGMTELRTRVYAHLAVADPATVVQLSRGDLLARTGADVDAVGDVVVRALLPAAVAVVVGSCSAALVGAFLPLAGVALAMCLLLAGVGGPLWALHAARAAEQCSARARVELSTTAMSLVDDAAQLRVSGQVDAVLERLRSVEADLARAADAAAGPAAASAAVGPLSIGLAVLASVALGIAATTAGTLAPVGLAVVVLTPLAAFEAVSMLPTAAVAWLGSLEAARRVLALLDVPVRPGDARLDGSAPRGAPAVPPDTSCHSDAPTGPASRAVQSLAEPVTVSARGLSCGWPGRKPAVTGIDLTVTPGHSIAIVGPIGVGKTTLLLTLAGLLPPVAGEVRVGGVCPHLLRREDASRLVAMTAEDAHVFDTTVLENLRVARGDVTREEATRALASVGLGSWVAGLPDGLDTLVGGAAARLSGGERRRLLLARALLGPAPVLLLDEPTEHVDGDGAELLTGLLDGSLTGGRSVIVVTHRLTGCAAATEVLLLGDKP
jgi:ATP-binding cassette, subfamily C, bacterial CydC